MKLMLGRTFMRLGRHDDARRSFQGVLQDRGDDVRAYLFLGRIALLDGDLAQARRELAAAQRIDPTAFDRWLPRILGEQTTPCSNKRSTQGGGAGTMREEAARADADSAYPFTQTSPFTQPGSGMPGAGEGASWFWYMDASGQHSTHRSMADAWADAFGADAEPDAETDFWSSLSAEAGEQERDGMWWRDSNGPQASGADEIDAAEEQSFFGSDEASDDDDNSWLADPLAAFYDELVNAKEKQVEQGYGDFSSLAEVERFSSLPPIERSEFEEIDWEQLGALFTDES